MGALAVGQVVLVPFPFSDLSSAKMRPAVVLAYAGRDDWILCQVTSNPYGDERAIILTDKEFKTGSLRVTSYARPGKLFTANNNLIVDAVGELNKTAINRLIDAIIALFQDSVSA
ncbi:MAG: MazF family transcriptional regulator [Anaerolineae bacterium]|nr:MAG: MazF family transcriptional regulator [Anaerolineae bacterium]WKZ45560.1 MAG: type II toxin-antitoxin system PemK/MazF family toxin [Anaerolineales bacterium]